MEVLDLRGVRCPLPIVRLNNRLKTLEHGTTVSFRADDPAFPLDVQAWARRTGHDLTWHDVEGTFEGTVTKRG